MYKSEYPSSIKKTFPIILNPIQIVMTIKRESFVRISGVTVFVSMLFKFNF